MSKTYVIHWASRINGRLGTGTTLFEKEEAEQLVEELNRDFPDIHHEVVSATNLQGNEQPEEQAVTAECVAS